MMSVMGRRTYESPLRERQAQQTRGDILDALVALLADRAVDEVTTKEVASVAGVSERTVYRHFPDRTALVEGLTERFMNSGERVPRTPDRFEDLPSVAVDLMSVLEAHHVEAQAEALLNADPRRFTSRTSVHTAQFRELIASGLPQLDTAQQQSLAAVLRVLFSAQTWLRMRAEFGIDGDDSGPIIAWAIEALANEVERGNPPPPS